MVRKRVGDNSWKVSKPSEEGGRWLTREGKKKFLGQYQEYRQAIKQRCMQLQQQKSTLSQDISLEFNIAQREEELKQEVADFNDKCNEIEQAIQTVPEIFLQTILRFYYINGLTWEEVADETGYDVRHIRRLRDEALDTLQI